MLLCWQEREVEPALWKSVFYRPIEEFRRRIKAASAAGEKGREPLQKVQSLPSKPSVPYACILCCAPQWVPHTAAQYVCTLYSVCRRSRLRLASFYKMQLCSTSSLQSSCKQHMAASATVQRMHS